MKRTAAKKNRDMVYGDRYVREELERLEQIFDHFKEDKAFQGKLVESRAHYVGRPTPLYFAKNTTKKLGGGRLYLKLEGLTHMAADKINNALGQGLLAIRLGKKKLIAGTSDGQHGLAAAAAAATLGLQCDIYMEKGDMRCRRPNVYWMETLGARVIPVHRFTKILNFATDAAREAWMKEYSGAYLVAGNSPAPDPYPRIVKEFQSVIGQEVKEQSRERFGGLPDILIACAGGGSNALGLFAPFVKEKPVRLIAAIVVGGDKKSMTGQAAVGQELCCLHDEERVQFVRTVKDDVLKAAAFFARNEGIIASFESAHALAAALKILPRLSVDQSVVVNVPNRASTY